MAYFDQTLDNLLSREGIVANLKFRFVDDARLGMRPIRAGWRWKDGGMVYNREWVEEDIAAGEQKRTTTVVNLSLNSMVEYLKFTTEDYLDFPQLKLPTLDC